MDRRLFLLSTLALAGCGVGGARQTVLCDPGLGTLLLRAGGVWGRAGALVLNEAAPRELLDRAETEPAALVVTRQGLVANRLQRLGQVRLEHRWQARLEGRITEILVTKGGFIAQARAVRFAKWLASDEASAILTPAGSSAP